MVPEIPVSYTHLDVYKRQGVEGATNYTNQGGSTWAITSNCQNVELATDFLGSTFAGSTELYDTILPGAGAISTWLPASESEVYAEPQEYYGGQAVYKLIAEFASKVPTVDLGVYYTCLLYTSKSEKLLH